MSLFISLSTIAAVYIYIEELSLFRYPTPLLCAVRKPSPPPPPSHSPANHNTEPLQPLYVAIATDQTSGARRQLNPPHCCWPACFIIFVAVCRMGFVRGSRWAEGLRVSVSRCVVQE